MAFYSVEDFENDCNSFNLIAGKAHNTSHQDLLLQMRLIEEETKELRQALEENNPKEVLKEAIDLQVVLFGLFQRLKYLKFAVRDAMVEVAANNFSKFPADKEVAQATIDALQASGVAATAKFNNINQVYVIKDDKDKVRKPVGYKPVDLDNFVPFAFRTEQGGKFL